MRETLLIDVRAQEHQAKKGLEISWVIVHHRKTFRGMEIDEMVSKVERERRALEAAEKDLQERREKLVELEREEAQRELDRCLKKVGSEHALELLRLAIKVKPKAAVAALRDMADPKGQTAS
ncbi:MAG: hypothetical protein C0471_09725 [Erythrobacter sp.]|nr:hypothetical protein [Erythrobacter sp.]